MTEVKLDAGKLQGVWTNLAILFVARMAVAFQFQAVAALAPDIGAAFAVDFANIGLLIGLYFAPGIVLALPGGAIGRRFGDKPTVLTGLSLMLIGDVLAVGIGKWELQLACRLIAGIGGVILNVMLTKMMVDIFAGRKIAGAMALFISSWPIGIAIALVLLPPLVATFGLAPARLATAVPVIASFVLLICCYHRPIAAPPSGMHRFPAVATTAAVVVLGLTWGLYNIGFAMVFSFGPATLIEHGALHAQAAARISIVLWLAILSVPLGGFIVDKVGHGDAVLAGGCLAFALAVLLLARSENTFVVVLLLGTLCGLPAAAIMSLPAQLLGPHDRALGMGIFYTVYYACMLAGPAIGGWLANWSGSAQSALDFGAAALLVCPICLWSFRLLHRQHVAAA
ncbi:MAG TPA: MFS transporter [Dongiaceae bacterium]|nr:MFS transporter [Dongiaceae bacterium]